MASRIELAPHQPEQRTGCVIQDQASILAADGIQVTHAGTLTAVKVTREVTDDRGEHFYQLDNGHYILKNAVTLDPDLWQTALKSGQQPFSLNAENINQSWCGMPNGCEPAALLEGLHVKGYAAEFDYLSFLKEMPRAADFNPYHGFGGEPDQDVAGHFEAIFPKPLVAWAQKYAPVSDVSGLDAAELPALLQQKKPVVAYVTVGFETPEWSQYSFGQALSNNHAVLVDGYFGELLHVSDPIDGRYWLSLTRFKTAYDARHWAIAID
ncbi:C39 family peptidase [Secundilactobacillus yichangensis]|uniref:C39 family peptidase n=1 Tax=Secundilactobacillus yichangensis TaxID=2799580 RepID=UPI001941ADA4|nr:C39 family peptidase [Secundilactobacillus yichangensis]